MYSNTLVKGVSCSIQFLVPMKSREGKHKTLNKCTIKIMLITLVTHFGKMLPFLSWNKSYSIKGPSFKPWRSIETPCPTPQQTCTKVADPGAVNFSFWRGFLASYNHVLICTGTVFMFTLFYSSPLRTACFKVRKKNTKIIKKLKKIKRNYRCDLIFQRVGCTSVSKVT